jgi:hypothetical protein
MSMNRRRALMTLAGGASVGGGLAQHLLESTAPADTWTAASWRQSLEGIADAYVRQRSRLSAIAHSTGRTETLIEALGQLGIPRQTAAALLASGRSPQLSAHIRQDFERGRTTEVDGWVLSATEVAVALVAWSEPDA